MDSDLSPDCVRDYIYLDTNRAKSIYSQLNRGLMQSYMKANEATEASSQSTRGQNQTLEQSVLLGTNFEATHVLHDILYTATETDLENAIADIQSPSCVQDLKPGDYIRVCGAAHIDDT